MSKPLNNLAVTMPKSMSWEADDDEFMDSVREDSKKFVKNTQASPAWSKPEPKEKRSGSNLQWSMPNPLGSPASPGTGLRFEALAPPTRKSNSLGTWR